MPEQVIPASAVT